MTAAVSSLAPVTLATTTLAARNLTLETAIVTDDFQHSGNEFKSVLAVPGSAPKLRFSTPFNEAYALIGLKALELSVCDFYLSSFSAGLKLGATSHIKYALTASCKALAYITGVSASQNGVAMADVEVVILSNNGTTAPLTRTTGNSLPTLSAEPALYTVGPISVNGTAYGGVRSINVALNPVVDSTASDGCLYPIVATYLGGTPEITIETQDPATSIGGISLIGAKESANLVAYLRGIDAATQLATTTGISLTCADGRIIPDSMSAEQGQLATGSLRMIPLSSSSTYPIAVATGASLPTP